MQRNITIGLIGDYSESVPAHAIRHARESAVAFLGTCGGFQHAVQSDAPAVALSG